MLSGTSSLVKISNENLRTLCPIEFKEFMEAIKIPRVTERMVFELLDGGVPLINGIHDDFVQTDEEWEELTLTMEAVENKIEAAYRKLQVAFEKETRVKKSKLSLSYVFPQNGTGQYDYFAGAHFQVNDVYVLSEAAIGIEEFLDDVEFL